jgi:hypothetical protein
MEEAQELVRIGVATTVCQALAILLERAEAANPADRVRRKKIVATQKANGCRNVQKRKSG